MLGSLRALHRDETAEVETGYAIDTRLLRGLGLLLDVLHVLLAGEPLPDDRGVQPACDRCLDTTTRSAEFRFLTRMAADSGLQASFLPTALQSACQANQQE